MKCSKCGADLPQSFKFCPQCGNPAAEEPNASVPQWIAEQPNGDSTEEPTMAAKPAAAVPEQFVGNYTAEPTMAARPAAAVSEQSVGNYTTEPTMAATPAASVMNPPAATFAQRPPVSAQPVNPYPPQQPRQPVPGAQYGQTVPGAPGMPPQGMGMMPQMKSPFVKGAWFAPAGVAVGGLVSFAIMFLLDLFADHFYEYYWLMRGILNELLSTLLWIGILFGLYFVAYAKTDPIQKKKRLGVVFVPMGVMWLVSGVHSFLFDINYQFCYYRHIYNSDVYSIIMWSLQIVFIIVNALISFALMRMIQKKLDEIQQKRV